MSEESSQKELELESSTLRKHLILLYEAQQYCDVKLHAHDSQLYAHKCILATKSAFLNLLLSEVGPQGSGCVGDVYLAGFPKEDVHSVGSVIRYMYTGLVNVTTEDFLSIFRLSAYFGMSDLQELLMGYIEDQVENGSGVEWYMKLLTRLALGTQGQEDDTTHNLSTHCLNLAQKNFYTLATRHHTLMEIPSVDLNHVLPNVCYDGDSVGMVISYIRGWLTAAVNKKQLDEGCLLSICQHLSVLIQSSPLTDSKLPDTVFADLSAVRDLLAYITISDITMSTVMYALDQLQALASKFCQPGHNVIADSESMEKKSDDVPEPASKSSQSGQKPDSISTATDSGDLQELTIKYRKLGQMSDGISTERKSDKLPANAIDDISMEKKPNELPEDLTEAIRKETKSDNLNLPNDGINTDRKSDEAKLDFPGHFNDGLSTERKPDADAIENHTEDIATEMASRLPGNVPDSITSETSSKTSGLVSEIKATDVTREVPEHDQLTEGLSTERTSGHSTDSVTTERTAGISSIDCLPNGLSSKMKSEVGTSGVPGTSPLLPVTGVGKADEAGVANYHENSDTDLEEVPLPLSRGPGRFGGLESLMSSRLEACLALLSKHSRDSKMTNQTDNPGAVDAGEGSASKTVSEGMSKAKSRKRNPPRRLTRIIRRRIESSDDDDGYGGDRLMNVDQKLGDSVVVKMEVQDQHEEYGKHMYNDDDDGDDDDDFKFEGYSYVQDAGANGIGMVKTEMVSDDSRDNDNDPEPTKNASYSSTVGRGKQTRFACKKCNKTFCRRSRLRQHVDSQCGKKGISCPICSLVVSRSDHLLRHMKRKHSDLNEFPCNKCGEVIVGARAGVQHRLKNCKQTAIKPKYSAKTSVKTGVKTTSTKSIKPKTSVKTDNTEQANNSKFTSFVIKGKGTRFQCNLCHKLFNRRSRVRDHVDCQCGEKGFHCPVCGLVISRREHLLRHLNHKHSNVKEFPCDVCNMVMSDAKTAISHRLTHGNLPTILRLENTTLTEKERCMVNEQRLESGQTEFTCKFCEIQLKTIAAVKSHAKNHFEQKLFKEEEDEEKAGSEEKNSKNNIYKCDKCKKAYMGQKHYDEHLTTCKIRYPCDKCDLSFLRPSRLQDHQRRIHEAVISCSQCDQTFENRRGLATHTRFMHNYDKPKDPLPQKVRSAIICEVCGLSFKDNHGLRRHMSDHTGQKEYKCAECEKQYRDKASLNSHVLKVHLQLKPFMCEICAMEFSMKSNMLRHLRRHRGEYRFFCDTCGKGFVANCDLNRHKLTHSTDANSKKHACKFCGKTFTRANKVIIHERIHTGEKPYECTVCNKRFTQNGDRLRHESRMHNVVHTKHQTLYEMANDTPAPSSGSSNTNTNTTSSASIDIPLPSETTENRASMDNPLHTGTRGNVASNNNPLHPANTVNSVSINNTLLPGSLGNVAPNNAPYLSGNTGNFESNEAAAYLHSHLASQTFQPYM